MFKTFLHFFTIFLLSMTVTFAQTLNDYVSEVRGDTLVIKDFTEMGNVESSIINAVELDTDAPAGRVYMLITNGYYPLSRAFTGPADRPLVIVGEDNTRLVTASDPNVAPPILCGATVEGATNTGGLNFQNTLVLKNISALPAVADGSLGWAFFGSSAPDQTMTLENVMMEHTRWVFIQSNDFAGTSVFLKDCYFVNASGQACRRNGGVYDNVGNNTDTMYVENCTHVMAQGMMYKFRNFPVNKIFFNHNTFVNMSGTVFPTMGYHSNYSVTNSLFVNSNIQPYMPGLDKSETDQDELPMGLININTLPAGSDIAEADRKVLVDANGLYWDSILDDMVSTVNSNAVNFRTDWVSQMITMNSRTQAMFDNDNEYPLLTEGKWYMGNPNFTDPKDLMTDQVEILKAFSMETIDTASTNTMAPWRTSDNPAGENYIYSDWPIPVDLSYSNAEFLTGAYAGLPLGDLNWFPSQKATWDAQKAVEHAAIETALAEGHSIVGVEDPSMLPDQFQLNQNFPNPFNPTTVITFTIPQAENVSLKVYDLLGKNVKTLVNGFKSANTYNVQFNASELATGVYLYSLQAGDFVQSKKMILIK